MAAIDEVVAALRGPRHDLQRAATAVPDRPGLYAIYGDEQALREIGLPGVDASDPLYVGKAEDSLLRRDVRTHFAAAGRTGSSTVRRSFAALLRDQLGLTAMPRNLAKPADFDRFGLSPIDDGKLTAWMQQRLQIATWVTDGEQPLRVIESAVLRLLNPPLNLTHAKHRHQPLIRSLRSAMAHQAADWRPDQ